MLKKTELSFKSVRREGGTERRERRNKFGRDGSGNKHI
jgi:hypothetical protein